jgi:hypothetical protein
LNEGSADTLVQWRSPRFCCPLLLPDTAARKRHSRWRSTVPQPQEHPDAACTDETQPADDASAPTLAIPSHAQAATTADVEDSERERCDKPRDPISEAGWLAAVDAMLMGGLGDW